MKTKSTLGLLALLVCSAAGADPAGNAALMGADRSAAVMLYFEVPMSARHRKPAFGLRVERHSATGLAAVAAGPSSRSHTEILDVRFNKRAEPGEAAETQALSLGAGAIVGIAVGAAAALAVLSDDDDGDGGGY